MISYDYGKHSLCSVSVAPMLKAVKEEHELKKASFLFTSPLAEMLSIVLSSRPIVVPAFAITQDSYNTLTNLVQMSSPEMMNRVAV